jgi:ABC-type molybdate transport system permease subunit
LLTVPAFQFSPVAIDLCDVACDFPVRHDPGDLQWLQGVEVKQTKLARTFGASKAQILTEVMLPGSSPTMIAALNMRPAHPVVMRFVPIAFRANQDHATNRKRSRYERAT